MMKVALWWNQMKKVIRGEEGQAMAEYALILALVSVVSISILSTLGYHIRDVFQEIVNHLHS
jgi:pilus assembly protein Flp/PilA